MLNVSVLICDDSNMARKQLVRALPADWPVTLSQAENGQLGLDLIRQQSIQVVFLDLTMPVLDGYGVLAALQREQLHTKVIVISADVQEEAVKRVLELGALAFLEKPVDPELLLSTLKRLSLYPVDTCAPQAAQPEVEFQVSFREAFSEIVNVAMGLAAAKLAQVLGVFVRLPVPNVNILEVGELHMALLDAHNDQHLTAICQGYIGGGISGEALLIFYDSEVADVAKLMRWHSDQEVSSVEMLLDLSGLLIGACLSSLASQLDIDFSQGHPQVLGQHVPIDQMLHVNQKRWRKMLAVEISYGIEGHHIRFDLLLLFTEDSIPLLQKRLAYLD